MSVALITGAASGIGAATARLLGEEGHTVLCADLDIAGAEALAATLPAAQGVQLDVCDEAACEQLVRDAVANHGGVDLVVTCAGANVKAAAQDLELDAFQRVMAVNVTGSFLVARAAARALIAQQRPGAMVLIGSINSVLALANQAAYATSKSAVLMLGKVLAIDWAPHGIRVNVVGPGLTNTPMAAGMIANPARMAWAMERIPLKRVAEPVDIAEVVSFLLSERARHVTGTFVPVDGGWMTGA